MKIISLSLISLVATSLPCALSHSATTVHYNSNNTTINNIDNHALSDPSSLPNDKFLLVSRNNGNILNKKATWDIGATTSYRPNGWNVSGNNVQRARKTSYSPAFQAKGTTFAWLNDAAYNDPAPGSSGDCFGGGVYRFSSNNQPRPWQSTSGKLSLKTRLKVPSSHTSSDVDHNVRFTLYIHNRAIGQGFYFQDKFYRRGGGPGVPTHKVKLDPASNRFMAIAKHINNSNFHTRVSGSFKSSAFTAMTTFEVTINRTELGKMIDDLNDAIDAIGYNAPHFTKNWGDYYVTSYQVNSSMNTDLNKDGNKGNGHLGVVVDYMRIATIQ